MITLPKILKIYAYAMAAAFSLTAFSGAHAGGASLRRAYAKMSLAGGHAEVLEDNALLRSLDDAEGEDFYSHWSRSGSDIQASATTQATLTALESGAQSRYLTSETCYSGAELASLFLSRIKNQSVVVNQSRYDPEHKVGFCFGRALIAHTQSLLQKRSVPVLKMWAIGSLSRASVEWRYHVTTLVLGCDRKWYTLDTLFRAPMTPAQWIQAMKSSYAAGPTNDYRLSRADRMSPEGGEYDDSHFSASIYSDYFKDYLDQNPDLRDLR